MKTKILIFFLIGFIIGGRTSTFMDISTNRELRQEIRLLQKQNKGITIQRDIVLLQALDKIKKIKKKQDKCGQVLVSLGLPNPLSSIGEGD